jgi:hypothetical protein
LIHDTWVDFRHPVMPIDGVDLIHAGEVQDDRVGIGDGASRETGARSSGHDGFVGGGKNLDDRLDFGR